MQVDSSLRRGIAIGLMEPAQPRLNELAEWFESQYASLVRFGFVLTADWATAEDLVQETFVRLYGSRTQIRREGFPAYARRTMVNVGRTRFRRIEREHAAARAQRREHAPDPSERPGQDEVWDAICALPPQQRAIVALRFYEDMSEVDIARTLGLSQGTIKKQASRAMEKLRGILGREES